jgi:branched-chain amino acid transport system substrate-binding protein
MVRAENGRSKSAVRRWGLADETSPAHRSLLCLLIIVYGLTVPTAADIALDTPQPFFRLRDSTLGYHGPATDFTNLTELRIGWFGPTNLDDPLAGDLWWAANLAIQEANDRSANAPKTNLAAGESEIERPGSEPQNIPFRLVSRWSVDPWGTGVSQLTRMIYEEQPLALLGSVDSASTHLAEQVAAKVCLPLVSPISTDKSITLAGVSWMFSCAPSDAAIARLLVDDLLAQLSAEDDKLAIMACTDHESRMTAQEVLKVLSQRHRLPDFRFDVPPGTQDAELQLHALGESRPTVVLIIAGAEDAARLVISVRNRFPNQSGASRCLIFGSHAMGRSRFLNLAGPAAEGVRFPLLCVPDPADAEVARFTARFAAEHRQQVPDYTAFLTYDATRLLLEAIERAGPNRARVREALVKLSPWTGIAGLIRFDGTGQNTREDSCMGTLREGAMIPFEPAGSSRKSKNVAAQPERSNSTRCVDQRDPGYLE